MLTAFVLALATVAAAASPPEWNGIALGAPVAPLRATLGDPLRIVSAPDGSERVGRYWLGGTKALYLIGEQQGYVTMFSAFTGKAPDAVLQDVPADPSGARLGDTIGDVEKLHPGFAARTNEDGVPELAGRTDDGRCGVVYSFANGRLRQFLWTTKLPDGTAPLPALSLPDGTSPATAILDAQKTETTGVRWEYVFISYHPCDGQTEWKLKQQGVRRHEAHVYDVLHVVCPATNAKRDFFFDITPYFGKI